MRVAILSDIHGNLPALDAVMKDVESQSPDEIWCGGDIVWGAWPGEWASECLARVREGGWKTVKGNTDVWVTGDPQTVTDPEMRRHVEEMAAAHNISRDEARWLSALPIGVTGPGSLLLVHGTPASPFDAPGPTDPEADYEPFEDKASLIVFGHVHRAFTRRLNDGTIVVNTGAVGLPMDGSTASYLMIDHRGATWAMTHRRVYFDVDECVRRAEQLDAPVRSFFVEQLRA